MVEKLYDTLHLVWKTYHYSAKSRISVQEIHQRFSALLGDTDNTEGGTPEAVRCLNAVFNHDSWPESSTNLAVFGEKEIDFLLSYFE